MKRLALLAVAAIAVLASLVVAIDRRGTDTTSGTIKPTPDSVWYHASDVSLLASTGRPQLLEFFHPN